MTLTQEKKWISYFRNSLADAARMSPQEKLLEIGRKTSFEQLSSGVIDSSLAEILFKLFETEKKKNQNLKSKTRKTLMILT